ncbi:Replication initiation factor family protein, partial [Neisseria meningitidis]|nr:Replication initiation factor family protein [Neisseria meningitidis]
MSEAEYFSHFISNGNGKLLEIPQRRGRQDGVFIDWLSFTLHEDSLLKVSGCPLVSDAEYMFVLSKKLEEILGFGITSRCKSKGNKFYDSMFRLGSEEVDYGEVHYGGQRNTVLIELKGVGCNIANPGWELRLKQFLEDSLRPRITRVDLALDFFDGEYTPEQALLDHDNGFFDNSNQRPKSETIGTAWRNEDGSGKTFYVGR